MKILKSAEERTAKDIDALRTSVEGIIANVVKNGDEALFDYNNKFDKNNRKGLKIEAEEIQKAYKIVSEEEIEDIKYAAHNIESFAKAQKETMKELKNFSPMEGIILGHKHIPVDSCLCYVPGGSYPLYSTALMLGIAAKVAGVKRIAACSPADADGNINPKTLVAMDIAGIDEIYCVGGAQAIAAFTYGTNQISPVSLIVGPGNSYVTEAKKQCYGKVGIDFLAGPSEVLVIADECANPRIIASDILAQSEHDRNAKGIVVTTSQKLAGDIIDEVSRQLETLQTADIAKDSWDKYGEILLVESVEEAIEYTNSYAPEHLEIMLNDADEAKAIEDLNSYGSLFIGDNSAEVFGDYASGTNHTLPTLGAAKYTGGVWVGTFTKTCTYQRLEKNAVDTVAPIVSRLARGEGLEGHARAALSRVKK